MRIQVSLIVAIVAASQLGATNCGQVLRDPGFDLWCGDSLCAWKTERGQIAQVATWHAGDSGVSMLGSDTAIEQLAPVNGNDTDCIHFDLVANIDDDAEVYLNVDLEGDGTLEMHERLPTSNWAPLTYNIALTSPYDGIRFELTKTGAGNAVLANIGASTDGANCAGLTPLVAGPRPNGGACNAAADCMSGLCVESKTPPPAGAFLGLVCAGCDPAQPSCTGTDVCGVADPISPILAVPMECVAPHARELGEACLANSECVSSICTLRGGTAGKCSACNASSGCPSGQTCGPSWTPVLGGPPIPDVCAPGEHLGTPGEGCGDDGDCASGHCNGTVRQECSDGRSCASPATCPFDGNLDPGSCTTVGVQGGSCQ